MIRSTSDTTTASTTSPTTISPFSSHSVRSEPTSDELPDLGAFTTVFRALNHLQAPRALSISTGAELDSDAPPENIWSHRPIASYLSHDHETSESYSQDSHSPSPSASEDSASGSGSDTEGEVDAQTVEIEEISDIEEGDQPSLGYLDEALSFIAAERARYAALREAGTKGNGAPGSTAESSWRHVVEPRRKRRRKRAKASPPLHGEPGNGVLTTTTDATGGQNTDDSSSSFEETPSTRFKSTPATPRRTKKEKEKRTSDNLSLTHSRSTPSLRLSLTIPPDPQVLQLRSLAFKLSLLFPQDKAALSTVLSNDFPDSDNFIDPRGPAPRSQDTLIHVFIDHSNILIGLLTYVRRHLLHPPRKSRRLSHAALALILERGRPITRRVLVTSSPLYQPMETAEQLGYEVRVYARVPDTGDGPDRRQSGINTSGGNSANSGESAKGHWRKPTYNKGHARKISGTGSTSTESEAGLPANVASFQQAFVRTIAPPPTRPTLPHVSSSGGVSGPRSGNRVRYREQGVDELLQLKLHQAIADVDVPPPRATIVLATGDGNVGQFNEEGFLGPVRTALKKGWNVELYCWLSGLSKAWMREFGEGPYRDRFKVIEMEQFGADMLEM